MKQDKNVSNKDLQNLLKSLRKVEGSKSPAELRSLLWGSLTDLSPER
ncbi:hypothetical protein [Paenibacillus maysiensis]|jgi:hypothetical protein|nr:hypothetical protein [Paenibacillus maysiensis]